MSAEGWGAWKSNPEWSSDTTADLIERIVRAEDALHEGIELIPTPGHTEKHYSLGVETDWGRLVVAGDAAMTIDFFKSEEGFYNSIDFDKASNSIRRIKERADLVVPGHGNYFLNRRKGKN